MDNIYDSQCDDFLSLIQTRLDGSLYRKVWTLNNIKNELNDLSAYVIEVVIATLKEEGFIEEVRNTESWEMHFKLTDKGAVFHGQGGYAAKRFREYQAKMVADEMEQLRLAQFRMEQRYMKSNARTNIFIVLWTCIAAVATAGQLIVSCLEKFQWAGTIQFLTIFVVFLVGILVGLLIWLIIKEISQRTELQ